MTTRYHNPENVPADKVPNGWRFLTEEELKTRQEANRFGREVGPCRAWGISGEFSEEENFFGTADDMTYIIPDTQPEPAPSPWIAFSERKPTEDDLPYVCGKDGALMETRFKGYGPSGHDESSFGYTHWMPIPPLPVERKKSQEEEDAEAFTAWSKTPDGQTAHERSSQIGGMKTGFLAGLRHARAQGKEGV